jgi:peptide chain release factor 3
MTPATRQVLYSQDDYVTDPILAAVGQLQFEVVQFRQVLPVQTVE